MGIIWACSGTDVHEKKRNVFKGATFINRKPIAQPKFIL